MASALYSIFVYLLLTALWLGQVEMKKKEEKTQNYDKCRESISGLGKYGFDVATNANTEFTFCLEHSQNTCCNSTNLDLIRSKVGGIRYNGADISQKCIDFTSKMFCTLCDGGIGTGKREGICEDQCIEWYNQCKSDFFTGDARASELGAGEITFCNKNSLVCSRLDEITTDPKYFCKQMGISVSENSANCYNGVSWALLNGKGKSNVNQENKDKSTYNAKKKKKIEEQNTWFDNMLNYTLELYMKYPITFIFIYGIILLFFMLTSTCFLFRRFAPKDPQIDDKIREKRLKKLGKKQN